MKTGFSILIFALLFLISACKSTPDIRPLSQTEKEKFMRDGKNITLVTFSTLSARLGKAIKEQGIQGAITYCNVAALPLTDSLSRLNHVEIKRTSLQLRNQENAPSEPEKNMLMAFDAQDKAGTELKPVVQAISNDKAAFFAPIRMMDVCQKCHGTIGETMDKADYAHIQSLYPEDTATGFKTGDLRGMWSITFQR
jgi:cytochrome c553